MQRKERGVKESSEVPDFHIISSWQSVGTGAGLFSIHLTFNDGV